jgi:hypothetical protein
MYGTKRKIDGGSSIAWYYSGTRNCKNSKPAKRRRWTIGNVGSKDLIMQVNIHAG